VEPCARPKNLVSLGSQPHRGRNRRSPLAKRRSLVDVLATLRTLIVLICVVAIVHPSWAGGARRKRSAGRHAKTRHHTTGKKATASKTSKSSKTSSKAAKTAKTGRGKKTQHARARSHRRATEVGGRGSVEEHVHIRRGDTLEALLAGRGLGTADAQPWMTAAAGVYDLRYIRPRRGLTLRFDRASHELESIRYEIDDKSMLVLETTADGIVARREGLPYFVEIKGVAGRIERGLREDALESGVPEPVVAGLADIFGWDVDVEGGLKQGDEFRVIYENIWQAGADKPEIGTLLGAQIVSQGEQPTTSTAVFFEDADGHGAYYNPTGDAVSRTLLRYPVQFTEISSEFSLLRRHPILHRDRPHLGVDFAAPRGTPVRAVASGHVSFSAWTGGLGECVKIEHADGLVSVYGHLSEITPGAKEGAAVEQGQVIGYVGATGLATGPHLHYALERDGDYVDPLSLPAPPPEEQVPAKARRAFERIESTIVKELASLQCDARPTTLSLSTSLFQAE